MAGRRRKHSTDYFMEGYGFLLDVPSDVLADRLLRCRKADLMWFVETIKEESAAKVESAYFAGGRDNATEG